MNEELAFKCRECDFVAYEAEIFNLHTKEHGFPATNMLDTLGKWTTPMVKLLIMLYADNKNKYGSMHWPSKKIWKNVAAAMSGMGYIVNPHQCNEKWRNLKKTYIKIRDTVGKTGSRRNNWEFYYEMEEALGESSNPPVIESGTANAFKEYHLTEDNPDITTSETYDLSSELSHLKDQANTPASPSPASPSYSGEFNQENSLKRKMPPIEWYDEYLEELRAARRDRCKRHQDKQIFRQQLIDLCKQMLMSSNNSIKTEIFTL